MIIGSAVGFQEYSDAVAASVQGIRDVVGFVALTVELDEVYSRLPLVFDYARGNPPVDTFGNPDLLSSSSPIWKGYLFYTCTSLYSYCSPNMSNWF